MTTWFSLLKMDRHPLYVLTSACYSLSQIAQQTDPGPHSIPAADTRILHWLRENGPTSAATLAEIRHVSRQAIRKKLTTMKELGLIGQKIENGLIIASIRPAGLKYLERSIKARNQVCLEIERFFRPEDVETAIEVVSRLQGLMELRWMR